MPKGGRREGAGRPKGSLGKKKLATKDIAYEILRAEDEQKAWSELLHSKDERIRFESRKYLTDRAYGKAPQAIELQASIEPWQVIVSHIHGGDPSSVKTRSTPLLSLSEANVEETDA